MAPLGLINRATGTLGCSAAGLDGVVPSFAGASVAAAADENTYRPIAAYRGNRNCYLSRPRDRFCPTLVTTLPATPAECGTAVTRAPAGRELTEELASVRRDGAFARRRNAGLFGN